MEASLLFIQRMGPWGIVLIVLVVLLLFGGKKIPELMKGLGKGVKEFKDATNNPDGNENPKGEVNEKNN
jgi:sec-independent protein translocase protein TatA